MTRVEGSAGEMVQLLILAPLFVIFGLIAIAVPTVPVTEVGEKLKVGTLAFIVSETLAVPFPEALVAVTM
jgi:hypothetical protein